MFIKKVLGRTQEATVRCLYEHTGRNIKNRMSAYADVMHWKRVTMAFLKEATPHTTYV